MSIGQKIVTLREKKGINTYQLAKELNMSHPMIYRIEKEQQTVSINLLIKLCKFFDVSADELLGLKQDRA